MIAPSTLSSAPPAQQPAPGRARRWGSRTALALPALVVAAFGGQLLVTGWTTTRGDGLQHVQDLAWGATEAILLLVALLVSLRRPERRPAALLQCLAVVGALLVTMALTAQPDPFTLVLGGLVVLGVGLSPARALVTTRTGPVHRPLAVLAAAAAVALTPYVLRNAADQRADVDVHAELLGYTGATVWAISVVAVLGIASLRTNGWRIPALSAAAAAAVVGAASIVWPSDASSLGVPGGLAALALAVAVSVVSVRR